MNENAFDSRDRLFLFAAFALGFLLFEFILFEGFGIGVPAFIIAFYASVFWYLSGRPGGIEKKGLRLLVPIALLSACFALYDNMVLASLNSLLLYALVALQLAAMTGNRLYKTFSIGLLIDSLHAGVVLPLANMAAPFRALRRKPDANGKTGRIGPVLIGLALSVPLLIIVLALLSSADIVFENGLNRIFSFLNQHIIEYMFKVFLGAIAAIPLFGLLSALRRNKRIDGMKRKIDSGRLKVLDAGIIGTVLILLNAVYLVFIAVQLGYLLDAFSSILSAGYNYSSYARRGFFELMGVVFINLGVISLSFLLSKRTGHGGTATLKAMETSLVILTLFLIASAFSKMAMYMDAYGLSLLRVYTSWFMLLCAIVFIAILVKLYVQKFALTRFCSFAFVALFLALNYANVDARIPQYNIYRYTSGISKTVDVEIFYNLSDSMIPYAAKLLDMGDKAAADKAKELLSARAGILNDNRWQVVSVARVNARNILNAEGITYMPRPGYRGPDGN